MPTFYFALIRRPKALDTLAQEAHLHFALLICSLFQSSNLVSTAYGVWTVWTSEHGMLCNWNVLLKELQYTVQVHR